MGTDGKVYAWETAAVRAFIKCHVSLFSVLLLAPWLLSPDLHGSPCLAGTRVAKEHRTKTGLIMQLHLLDGLDSGCISLARGGSIPCVATWPGDSITIPQPQ